MTDFSSIDRLLEFGMGISLARQMINTMNSTMTNMCVPGVNAQSTGSIIPNQTSATLPSSFPSWYVVVDEKMAGPMSDNEVYTLVNRRKIQQTTLFWRQGMKSWMMAQDIPEINKYLLLNS